MQTSNQVALGVLADDFTGALDAGVELVRAGFSAQFQIRPSSECSAEVLIVSSESRNRSTSEARMRVAAAVTRLQGRRLFKKIDSTMRGHVGAEIEVVLAATGLVRALICPAAIEAGRTVVDGQLLIQGVPIHQTAFAHDPHWPAATASMLALLGAPAMHVSGQVVCSDPGALEAAIQQSPTALVSVDAQSDSDLEQIARVAQATQSLPCGALGLARAWGRLFDRRPPTALRTLERGAAPALVLVGSRHPRSLAQLQALVATGVAETLEVAYQSGQGTDGELGNLAEQACAVLGSGRALALHTPAFDLPGAEAQHAAMAALADVALHICRRIRPGVLVIVGGETAQLAGTALDMQAVDIQGDVEVGVPWSIIRGGTADRVALVTKAGGFGDEGVLARMLGQP